MTAPLVTATDSRPRIEIRMKPQGRVLADFMRSTARVQMIMGPLGSGKTFQCCQKNFLLMTQQKPNRQNIRKTRWYAIRNTYPDLFSTTIKDWMELFGDLGNFTQGNKEPPTHRIEFDLPDGSTVQSEAMFLALDRDDHVKKLRGAQASWFWLNEIKELPKAIVDMADLRHGRFPSKMDGGPSWHGMMGDYNAPDDDHWLYTLAEEERPADWEFFRQPGGLIALGESEYIANPDAENTRNLPEGYYIRGKEGKADDWILVNLCNEYGSVQTGKPVHPEYNDSVHCAKDPIPYDPAFPLVVGMDFGRTPAAVLFQRNAMRYVAIDEFVTTDTSAATFGPQLKLYIDALYPHAQIEGWGDPAGDHAGQATDDTPIRILNAAGIPCSPCFSNRTVLRRAALANPLTRLSMDGKPGLIISPKCRTLRRGLNGGFCFRRVQVAGEPRYTEEPDKNSYSHVCEAAEYALLGAGEGHAALTTPGKDVQTQRRAPLNWRAV